MNSYCQTIIKGRITDEHRKPIPYTNVSVSATMDGTSADSLGYFKLSTTTKGKQLLQASALGFETLQYPLNMDTLSGVIHLKLKQSPGHLLAQIEITAGNMDANNDRILSHIKPVDLLSNASSQGDIIAAIQNLPGVQRNGGDQTGLFVRGGDASETIVLIDGIIVQNPFFSNVPGVGQRSRFNPFQLKGTSFSTGGYSARYGQALSSILDLQTTDLPEKTMLSAGINLSGFMLSGSKRMGDNALEVYGNYTNYGPYYCLSNTNYDFYSAPESTGISSRWISRTDRGLFKISLGYNNSNSGTTISNPNDVSSLLRFDLRNKNTIINGSYNYWFSNQVKLFIAAAVSNNNDHIKWADTTFTRADVRGQVRAELSWEAASKFKITTGTELAYYNYEQQFYIHQGKFSETQVSGYLEAEYKPFGWFAIKPGIRTEYSRLSGNENVAPRLSLAGKITSHSQLGLAGGIFYQSAPNLYLLQGYRPSQQKAVHYIVNYEWIAGNRSFRIEAFYKDYSKLVRESGTMYRPNPYRYDLGIVDNSGYGHAKGIDIFWRDKSSVKDFDYWITYSFIDTKRYYQNYPSLTTPDFVSKHNLNLIARYYPERLHTVFSIGYNYANGRAYYNPLATSFLQQKSPAYQNLSFKVSYLTNIRKMFAAWYVNIDNLTNYKNVLGYRYSADGHFKSPILPPQYRSIFFGVYLSISEFKKDEL
ncbi:carboxypeptidase-like regulatory domain-containing protein [Pedobacter sp. ok626]|uniref:TonB-dependent receptor n=1 Tax=Pedobacter sp. ok626 TaxID=1761882 RepID=UPI001404F3D8|nr:carboxypeptidase-like regulatory domain-containing protein [Pedobacter sp. ok626]